ncbi:Heme A synthase [Rickettsia prowazekii str. GvF12]|nr:Heme A synthase [Rickettsia prowazekii str. GvF12]EOB11029.1 Ribosomal large subunit pseudouridine synthase C [Rickettsia prowazekii str. Cairo 3]
MVILMIIIGGITRLTGAGLSIVEWSPVTGLLPPFSFESWQVEFAKYKAFPEYQSVNYDITLSQFKFIYLLEFIHRLLGRITTLIYIVPLICFYFQGVIKKCKMLPYIIALLLFCIQGFMGWYMVESGLLNNHSVSHFRLAFHLIIAVIIYHILFYQLIKNYCDLLLIPSQKLLLIFSCISITVIYIQIFLGALVAGLDAGLVYNNFPLMGDNFIPIEIQDNLFNLTNLYDPVFMQFMHRLGGFSVFAVNAILVICLFKVKHLQLTKIAYFLIIVLLIQIATGIITIVYSVPIIIASIHQFVAIILLSIIIWCYFLFKNS